MLKNLMIKLNIFITLLIVSLNLTVFASNFSSSAIINNEGSHKYKAIRITPEIYSNSNLNLADLRIFDESNDPIPYFVNRYTQSHTTTDEFYEMELINSFVEDDFFYFDYRLKTPLDFDLLANSLKLETQNKNFVKNIELFGGYDNKNWEKVLDDLIYNVDGNKKLELFFRTPLKYTHYRFKISNNTEKIFFTSAVLNFNETVYKKDYFIESLNPEFTISEKEENTVITLNNLKNLKLNSVQIYTDSIFKRNVIFNTNKSKTLYNLIFDNITYKDTIIPLDAFHVKSDSVEIIIENKDDAPINVTGITVEYLVDELIFDGSTSDKYMLKFGDSTKVYPPQYDIESYKDHVLNEGYDVLKIEDLSISEIAPVTTNDTNYEFLFNIVIVLISFLLGVIVVLQLKKVSKSQ